MNETAVKKILLIGQNKFDQFYYSYVLSQYYSCPVLTVDQECEVVSTMKKNPIDIIYIDISIYPNAGIGTLKNLRNRFPECKSPVVAIVEGRNGSIISKLIELGVNQYIVKTFKRENVFEKFGISFN